jgi:1-acyl-sn-glycerol-3-phosphate acyltransferase
MRSTKRPDSCAEDERVAPIVNAAATRPAPSRRPRPWSDPVRWLQLPWTIAIFYPVAAVTTVFWGTMAVLWSLVDRALGFRSGVAWAWLLTKVSFVAVHVTGRENLKPGTSYVFLANHQGNYDILALYGYLGREFRWVIKQELRKVPFLGWGCAAIGHIFVDRRDARRAIASLEAAKPQLRGGVSVVFFPEGTRTADGSLGRFKKGGFQMARQLGLEIVPVSITGSFEVLPKGCLAPRAGTIHVRLHPPVAPTAYAELEDLLGATRAAIAADLEKA